MSPTFGSLFAGVGGFDLGFERAGWDCRWQVEWDARCRSVLTCYWPDVARYGNVFDVHDPEPVDCITYGFPCQDVSVAGKRAGLDGDRSGLFFEATRIIREMLEATDGRYPGFAVAENVSGLLSADDGHAMGRVLDELADIGAVDIEWAVLDAQHFGVPQRRRRVFIIAAFGAGGLGAEPLLPVATLCREHHRPSAETREIVAALTANGVGTCGADDNQAQAGHLIPSVNGVRRLTPLECERLQGFPDDWTLWGADDNQFPDSARYRMMGNAVAVPVARWVARRIIQRMEQP